MLLVLGVTADDKGTQLEALVYTELKSQGYEELRANVVGTGGNELDVTAKWKVPVLQDLHIIPVVCEAKAYKDAVNMPVWQKFLGKLFLARSESPKAVGILVALNGVNGHVRGSHDSLRAKSEGVFIIDGGDLLRRAREAEAIGTEDDIHQSAADLFGRGASRVEAAYYGGGYFWIIWWNDEEYSVVNAHGNRLLASEVENLRTALEESVGGKLLATDEMQAQIEARHNIKVGLISRLLLGGEVIHEYQANDDESDALASLAEEPYSFTEEGRIKLISADELDADGIARFFTSIFENATSMKNLVFMIDLYHNSYVQRLIDTLPEQQAGFTLAENEERSLRAVAPLFPSVWARLAQPIQMITNHRTSEPHLFDEAALLSDRNTFWDEIIRVIRQDFTNIFFRGFLYDYIGVADLDEVTEMTVKTKSGIVGTMATTTRTAIRQLSDELVGEAGTRHMLIRLLPTVAEPWDYAHPDPIPLESPTSGDETNAAESQLSSTDA